MGKNPPIYIPRHRFILPWTYKWSHWNNEEKYSTDLKLLSVHGCWFGCCYSQCQNKVFPPKCCSSVHTGTPGSLVSYRLSSSLASYAITMWQDCFPPSSMFFLCFPYPVPYYSLPLCPQVVNQARMCISHCQRPSLCTHTLMHPAFFSPWDLQPSGYMLCPLHLLGAN